MSEEKKNFLSTFKDASDVGASLFKRGAFAAGGFCLLYYCFEIGQFPEGLGLGEGLAFYLISIAFVLFYGLYVAGVTALGCVLVRWPFESTWKRTIGSKAALGKHDPNEDVPADFSFMTNGATMMGALVGVAVIGGFILRTWTWFDLGVTLLLVIGQGFFVALWVVLNRQRQRGDVGLLFDKPTWRPIAERNAGLLGFQRVLVVMIALFPMAMSPSRGSLVDAAFGAVRIRKNDATIHVKKPWDERLKTAKMVSTPSFLGADHAQFLHVKVLLQSVGNKVVIELPATDGKPLSLPIPSDGIYVE